MIKNLKSQSEILVKNKIIVNILYKSENIGRLLVINKY